MLGKCSVVRRRQLLWHPRENLGIHLRMGTFGKTSGNISLRAATTALHVFLTKGQKTQTKNWKQSVNFVRFLPFS